MSLPERVGHKTTFGVYTIEDLMRGGVFLVVFVTLGLVVGHLALKFIFVVLGIILFWLFGLVKVDGMAFHNYLRLRLEHRNKIPTLGVSTLKVYDDGTVYNGRYWFKIMEVTIAVSLKFMSEGAKAYLFSQFQNMLNSCPFPMQFIVHSWKVDPAVFDRYINAEGELAEGYRRLIREHTRDLYLQSYYIVVIATRRDVKGATETVRYQRAREVLGIYVDKVRSYLKAMGMDARVLSRPSEVYNVYDEILRG